MTNVENINNLEKQIKKLKDERENIKVERDNEINKIEKFYDELLNKSKEISSENYELICKNISPEINLLKERYDILLKNNDVECINLKSQLADLLKENFNSPKRTETINALKNIIDNFNKFRDKVINSNAFYLFTSKNYKESATLSCKMFNGHNLYIILLQFELYFFYYQV